jgi:hypothetical protein
MLSRGTPVFRQIASDIVHPHTAMLPQTRALSHVKTKTDLEKKARGR